MGVWYIGRCMWVYGICGGVRGCMVYGEVYVGVWDGLDIYSDIYFYTNIYFFHHNIYCF